MTTMANTLSAVVKYEEDEFQYSRDDITVISGQNLALGAVLGKITASGKYTAYNTAGADGSQNAAGILTAAVNATAGDTAGVAIVRHAVISKEALAWGASVTTTGHKDTAYAALKALGVISRAFV
jgi:hypothetical protein